LALKKHDLTQKQVDRRTWSMLGLVILVLLGFTITVQALFVSIMNSGYLGERLPPGAWILLVGLVGLTLIFCLYVVRQQTEINRFRAHLMAEQMELEQSRVRLAELTSLFQLGSSLHMELSLDTILEIIVRRVASTLHSHEVSLFLYDPDTKTLNCRAAFGLTPRDPESDIPLGEGAVGWVARHREPLLMHANEREARFAEYFMVHSDAGSALVLPVTVENRCVAVLQVHRASKAEPFRLQHRDIGKLFADNVGAVIERALVVTKLQERASDRKPAAAAQADQTLTFQDSFLTAAENELKNPITTILAYAEVLDQNEKRMTATMRHEFTSRLRGETQRLLDMVDDVLDLARLETGRYLLDLRVDNVNKIARTALDTVRPVAMGKKIELEVKLDEKIPDQHMDTTKVKQAMLHLLRNAVRFSPSKGWITLSTWLCDDHVRVEVRDSGPSVEPEASSMVFDLHEQASTASKRVKDGLGFGLHLAKRFIELHGGEVGVGPGPSGLGAVFWIRLPRGDGPEPVIGKDPFLEQLWQGGSNGQS